MLVPWSDEYDRGGTGPNYVLAHGMPGGVIGQIRAGSLVWEDGEVKVTNEVRKGLMDGTVFCRFMVSTEEFQDLLDRNRDGSFVMVICYGTHGGFSDDFVAEMRRNGYPNRMYFANDRIMWYRFRASHSVIGVDHNGGLSVYEWGQTGGTTVPGTRY